MPSQTDHSVRTRAYVQMPSTACTQLNISSRSTSLTLFIWLAVHKTVSISLVQYLNAFDRKLELLALASAVLLSLLVADARGERGAN